MTRIPGAQMGRELKRRTGAQAFEKGRLRRAKVTNVATRTTAGIRCQLESTGETAYCEAEGAAALFDLAVNDIVYLKRITDGARNKWILVQFGEDGSGSNVPGLRDDVIGTDVILKVQVFS